MLMGREDRWVWGRSGGSRKKEKLVGGSGSEWQSKGRAGNIRLGGCGDPGFVPAERKRPFSTSSRDRGSSYFFFFKNDVDEIAQLARGPAGGQMAGDGVLTGGMLLAGRDREQTAQGGDSDAVLQIGWKCAAADLAALATSEPARW